MGSSVFFFPSRIVFNSTANPTGSTSKIYPQSDNQSNVAFNTAMLQIPFFHSGPLQCVLCIAAKITLKIQMISYDPHLLKTSKGYQLILTLHDLVLPTPSIISYFSFHYHHDLTMVIFLDYKNAKSSHFRAFAYAGPFAD